MVLEEMADHQRLADGVGAGGARLRIVQLERQRLLDVHVFAGVQGPQDDPCMVRCGHGDGDAVNARGEGSIKVRGHPHPELRRITGQKVGRRVHDNLKGAEPGEDACDVTAPTAATDECDPGKARRGYDLI